MRKKIALALLCVFLLLGLSGCVGSRTTTKEKRTAESQLREATVENKQTEKREATTAETNTESSEKRNIVIEFTKVEYYPDKEKQQNRFTEQFQKADSVFNEEILRTLKTVGEETTGKGKEETKGDLNKALKDKSKPPNVKSKITGRIVINGDKQETIKAKAATNKDEAMTEATTTTTEEDTKVTAQTKEKKYPKISPFLWVLIGADLRRFCWRLLHSRNKIVKK